jgi:hypothetical protein
LATITATGTLPIVSATAAPSWTIGPRRLRARDPSRRQEDRAQLRGELCDVRSERPDVLPQVVELLGLGHEAPQPAEELVGQLLGFGRRRAAELVEQATPSRCRASARRAPGRARRASGGSVAARAQRPSFSTSAFRTASPTFHRAANDGSPASCSSATSRDAQICPDSDRAFHVKRLQNDERPPEPGGRFT